jgi:hypothetical protein
MGGFGARIMLIILPFVSSTLSWRSNVDINTFRDALNV